MLFVGNSLTAANDLPAIVAALVDAAGEGPMRSVTVAFPDFGLQDHWEHGEARRRIAQGRWDLVVLQQGPSATEGRPSLLDYGGRFAAAARGGGVPVGLYMVWPSRSRASDFDGVRDSYRAAAQQVGGLFLPAGEAWRIAWEQDPALPLYGPDGFHPSAMGSYLAALVLFQGITGRSPVGLPADVRLRSGEPLRIDGATALVLQQAAAEAWRRFAPSESG